MSFIDDLRAHYSEQPHEVSLETQALCNARCTFCPYPTMERKGEKMPDALIARLVDEMAGFEKPFYFSPFKVNEPLLDKRTIPLCRSMNEKVPKAVLRLFTNGSTLTDTNILDIAGLKNLVHLWISLNEVDAQKYEATMGLDFAITTRRLDRLHSIGFPWQVVVSRVGPDEDFLPYVRERWPRFTPAVIKRDAWIDFTNADTETVPDTPCGRWWELNVTATGKAALCCMDGEARYGFGDVNTQTLLEIYNHPTLKEWRNGKSRLQAGSPCSGCTY